MDFLSFGLFSIIIIVKLIIKIYHLLCIRCHVGEGNGNPLQCSCLENLRDRGAWWAAVSGVTQSRTQLKWLSSSSKYHVNHIKESISQQLNQKSNSAPIFLKEQPETSLSRCVMKVTAQKWQVQEQVLPKSKILFFFSISMSSIQGFNKYTNI